MSDSEVDPDSLETSPEEYEKYFAYLLKLYYDEGNLTLPLWTFDKQVRENHHLLKQEYTCEKAVLGQHTDIAIRLNAIENAMESLQVDGSILFGLPCFLHAQYTRQLLPDDNMVRRLICGENKQTQQLSYYNQLVPIKKLMRETIHDIQNYLEGATSIDFYEDSQEMDLYSCLHKKMAETSPALMTTGWRGRSREGGKERYDVFISHAGEDKRTLAMPLNERLSAHGVNCFLDIEDLRPGDLGWNSMEHAMKTATIGVIILSPEFAAKRWPIKELDCFLKRREGLGESTEVVQVFYRLEREDCGAKLLSEGVTMFERLDFFKRVRKKETSEEFVIDTLQKVAMINGIENEEGADNWNSEEMRSRRERLIEKIVQKVQSALQSYPENYKARMSGDPNGSRAVADAQYY